MLCYSRTMRPGSALFFDQLRIQIKDGEVVFENAAHDYPQRIAYERVGEQLRARTELLDSAKPRTQSFNFKRVSCD